MSTQRSPDLIADSGEHLTRSERDLLRAESGKEPDMTFQAVKTLARSIQQLSADRPRRLLRNVFAEAMTSTLAMYGMERSAQPRLTKLLCAAWGRGNEFVELLGLDENATGKGRSKARATRFRHHHGYETDDCYPQLDEDNHYRPRLEI